MKVLQIGLDWFPDKAGGLQRYFYDVIRHSPTLGIEVKGVVMGSSSVARNTGGVVEAFAASTDSLAKRFFGARRLIGAEIRRGGLDLVVSHFALSTLPALDLIKAPLIVHFHGPWASESGVEGGAKWRPGVKAWIETLVYRRAVRCIVLSRAFAEILHKNYGVREDLISIVPGGVDVSRFSERRSRDEARRYMNWPRDRPILLSVRRLVRRMGLESLIEAMKHVARKQPDTLLLIAGRGPLASELEKAVAELELERNVRLLGFISERDLPMAYRGADFTVVPTSQLEGFGLIAVESLAAGTPVLVTPIGGLPEVVQGLSENLIFSGALPRTKCLSG